MQFLLCRRREWKADNVTVGERKVGGGEEGRAWATGQSAVSCALSRLARLPRGLRNGHVSGVPTQRVASSGQGLLKAEIDLY